MSSGFDLLVHKDFVSYQSGIATFDISVYHSGLGIRSGIDIEDIFSPELSRSGVVYYINFIDVGTIKLISANHVRFQDLTLGSYAT